MIKYDVFEGNWESLICSHEWKLYQSTMDWPTLDCEKSRAELGRVFGNSRVGVGAWEVLWQILLIEVSLEMDGMERLVEPGLVDRLVFWTGWSKFSRDGRCWSMDSDSTWNILRKIRLYSGVLGASFVFSYRFSIRRTVRKKVSGRTHG